LDYDFRDPWISDGYHKIKLSAHAEKKTGIFRRKFYKADGFSLLVKLQNRSLKEITNQPITVITNGTIPEK
jgi:hypothetical protein